jgi:circadian clock protein KaiC
MSPVSNIAKVPTGIQGFDEVTRGGLPRGQTTLVIGGPGAGKTIFALQTLASAARDLDEPGIFVAFEESSDRIRANAASLALGLENLSGDKLAFVDAQPSPDVILSGPCDLGGMLAALTGKVQQIGATRIVFDSIDALLDLVGDATVQRRELYRLHDWLIQSGLTAIITARSAEVKGAAATLEAGMQFAPFLVDCAIALRHHVESGISQRRLRVLKYRGSHFAENEAPFLIGPNGFEVAYIEAERSVEASTERVSSGVERLDTMLSGGYYRAASILITGVPGTAKSTLAGSFIAAACQRGERAVYVGFDENCEEMVRNLASVNIQLRPHLESGLLRMLSRRAPAASAEEHLLRIKAVVREHRPRCIAIDPLSALAQPKDAGAGQGVAARLVQWMKSEGVTLVCTSLLAHADPHVEETALEISTVADTWIHVSYSVRRGNGTGLSRS